LRVAVIGAGMAGITCALTLARAGQHVTVFEKSRGYGGRMATRQTPFGGFDHGAQYFTVRDERFALALQATPETVVPWSANSVRVLDALGDVVSAQPPRREAHYVAAPGMNALVRGWAKPLIDAHHVRLNTRVQRISPDPLHDGGWQLHTDDPSTPGVQQVVGGFDRVLMAVPHPQALALLQASGLDQGVGAGLAQALAVPTVAPCWTLMLAFPQAMQPNLPHLGPQWNAARSTHHRISWLAREGSKPRRDPIERWTVQASPAWSQEHINDTPERIIAKLRRAFTEVTHIHAEPTHAQAHRWLYAQTQTPLGRPFVWEASAGLGLCGDWCLGHRVEDAFVSGLELAQASLSAG
jgi:predicted NAD/FAD-dependent oxidoreductase